MDERLDKIEVMLRDIQDMILDMPRANREYGLYKPSPFNAKPEDLDKPPIPNGPDDPPPVYEAGIVKELALYDIPGTGLRWYADMGESVAIIRPFTEKYKKAHFTDCGRKVPTGCFSYGTLRLPGGKWKLVKTVRNPLAPEPECCGG
jgi:hypothetical protein